MILPVLVSSSHSNRSHVNYSVHCISLVAKIFSQRAASLVRRGGSVIGLSCKLVLLYSNWKLYVHNCTCGCDLW